ncbi:MAG TPA: GFA family protein [Sphingomicrobium sp.]|nr:GFA family protein [Sphingomicrobium sp.]
MDERLEGACGCGEIRYQLEGKPMFVHCCHCSDCQTQTGSAYALNALYESERVSITKGAPEPIMMPTDSGQGQQVWRCPNCRVAVWSNYGGAVDKLRFVRVGTLDQPGELPPDIHIYTRSKLPWVQLPAGVPAVEAYYDSKQLWPAASLERLRLVFG